MKHFTVAIDGPAGSGKSTVAKILAKKLGIIYVDTGAMYRALAYLCLKNNRNLKDTEKVIEILEKTKFEIIQDENNNQIIKVNGEDITKRLRDGDVAAGSSMVAKIGSVREEFVKIQKGIAEKKCVVMDGRDIGTCVLPDSDIKVFLTASIEERAKRRYGQMKRKGEDILFEEIAETIKNRDYEDMNRPISPLKAADDAVLIDTSDLDIDNVVDTIYNLIVEKELI